jgi:hypothetical protein
MTGGRHIGVTTASPSDGRWEQTLKAAKVFLDELRDRLGQKRNESEEARAKGAGDRVAKAVLKVE